MKQNLTLTITSLFTVVLTSLHFTDDNLHTKGGVDTVGITILLSILLVMVYATIELAGRRLGYAIIFLGGIAAAYMPYLHGMGPSSTRWGYEFMWTMLAMGVSGSFAAILAARAMYRTFRAPA